MKKIIIVFLFALILFPLSVNASSSFYEGEYLPNAYIKKFKPGSISGKYEQMKMFKRNDGTVAYCIELWETFNSNKLLDSYNSNYANITGLSEDIWNRVQLISYYGYGYQNHTDISWYIASQFMIWKTIDYNSTLYFTDTLNGNKVDKYLNEINEIENLIINHNRKPSFNNQTIDLFMGEDLVLNDTNNVINNYNYVVNSDLVDVKIENNNLILSPKLFGVGSLWIRKLDNINKTLVYIDQAGQNLLIRGNYPIVDSTLNINVQAGSVYISNKDIDTKKFNSDLLESTYGLYDTKMNLIETKKVDDKGKISFKNIKLGKYYIKQIKTGINYNLDDTITEITVSKNNYNFDLELYNKKISSKITINNYIEKANSNSYETVSGNSFAFYDSNNNEIGDIVTDLNGSGTISLDYGTYLVKQIVCLSDYKEIDNFYIDVIDNNDMNLDVLNKQYRHHVTINNYDSLSNKKIILNAKYKLKKDDKYIKYNNNDIFETNNGILIFPLELENGKYILEQIEEFTGYKRREDYEFIIEENNMNDISFDIYNDRKYGTIDINKKGEDNNQFINLPNIKFEIYAFDNIVTGDGTLNYRKDQLIDILFTDTNGNILYNKLLYGKYYIMEKNTNSKYILNDNKYYFEIDSDHLNYELEINNYLKKGSIKIISPIKEKSKYLLYDLDMNIISEYDSYDGEVIIYDLPIGKYYIKQKEIDNNYILNDTLFEANIIDNSDEVVIYVNNSKKENNIKVPKTLDDIDNNITYSFLGLIGIVLTSYFKRKTS